MRTDPVGASAGVPGDLCSVRLWNPAGFCFLTTVTSVAIAEEDHDIDVCA